MYVEILELSGLYIHCGYTAHQSGDPVSCL